MLTVPFGDCLSRFVPSFQGTGTAWKVSVFGVILVSIFSHLDWMRRDTENLSVFSPNAGKCRSELLRIRTLFTQWGKHLLNMSFNCYVFNETNFINSFMSKTLFQWVRGERYRWFAYSKIYDHRPEKLIQYDQYLVNYGHTLSILEFYTNVKVLLQNFLKMTNIFVRNFQFQELI